MTQNKHGHAPSIAEILKEPIVQALMKADRVDAQSLRQLIAVVSRRCSDNRSAVNPEANLSHGADKSYRPGVGIVLCNGEGRIFVGCRSQRKSAPWSMPQNAIFTDETLAAAALRGLKATIGAVHGEIIAETNQWFQYDLPASFAAKPSAGRWRGHRQKWFVVRFTGTDDTIDVSSTRSVFSTWKWVEARSVPDMAVPFKKQLYQDVLKEFGFLSG